MDTVYVVTGREFALLLASAGIRQLYGFQPEPVEPERGEVLLTLQEMHRKGWLVQEDDTFRPAGELVEALHILAAPESVLQVRKASGRCGIFYLDARESVRMSPSLRRSGRLELERIPTDRVWDWMRDEGWVPGQQASEMPREDMIQ